MQSVFPGTPFEAGMRMPAPLAPFATFLLSVLVAGAAAFLSAGTASASLERPTYTAGDRWIYVLQGSLAGFPGLNESAGNVSLGLSGLVEVDVVGAATATVGGAAVPGVRVTTLASGFLNGTFAVPGNMTVHASGTFSSDTTEVWEGQDFLLTVSNSSSTYTISVTLGLTFSVSAQVWVNATTAYASLPPFNLSVGESATAPFTTDVSVATTASFFGYSTHMENRTSATGVWTRQVLGAGNVSVEAGTFPAYRLNESLGTFPGLAIASPAIGTNETAWFSNEVGNDVLRQAYVNGTPVAVMRLKSYAYPAAPPGLSALDLTLLAAVPVGAAAIVVYLVLRRRKGRTTPPPATGSAGPVGELPPRPPGGGP